jgi:hypothetical protein
MGFTGAWLDLGTVGVNWKIHSRVSYVIGDAQTQTSSTRRYYVILNTRD